MSRLMELIERVRQDPTNAVYLLLLSCYTTKEIKEALDKLDS